MKKFGLLLSVLIVVNQFAWGQLLIENFEYSVGQLTDAPSGTGGNVSGGNWINFSGIALYLQVSSGSLNFTNYPSSGIGNKVDVNPGTAEDAYRQFATQGVGTKTFASFLMNLTSTTGLSGNTSADGDYTVSFMPSTSTTFFVGRVSLRVGSIAGTFNIGLRATSSNTTSWQATDYPINLPLLIVVSYEIISGNANDITNLWINPTLTGLEPTPNLTQTSLLVTDPTNIARITIRQGSNSFQGQLDGIRVADSWAQAPLPVELTSFSASVVGSAVKLNWKTETEVNNFGFYVERKSIVNNQTSDGWEKIGFVEGSGNSNSPKNYSFIDNKVSNGKYSFRLKQIDNDGQFEYSKTIEVDFGAPKKFELSQNYPNPFNPITTIRFNLPEAGNVKLTLFNILGQEIIALVNEFKESGVHTINFDASNLNSGMYIYKIESGSFVQTRKMTLVK